MQYYDKHSNGRMSDDYFRAFFKDSTEMLDATLTILAQPLANFKPYQFIVVDPPAFGDQLLEMVEYSVRAISKQSVEIRCIVSLHVKCHLGCIGPKKYVELIRKLALKLQHKDLVVVAGPYEEDEETVREFLTVEVQCQTFQDAIEKFKKFLSFVGVHLSEIDCDVTDAIDAEVDN